MAIKKSTKKMQPVPPKKGYTAKDSVQFDAVGKRLDKNIEKLNKAPVRKSGGMEFSSGLDVDIMPTMRKQMDSMVRNPYYPTYKAREQAKKAKTGGMKGTKPAPAKSMSKAKSKSMPVKKSMSKSTK